MATVLNRTTGNTGAYPYNKDLRFSVNTADFPLAEWIINPDLTAVGGQPTKYWQISGDVVSLADAATRTSIDADISAAEAAANIELNKARYDDEDILRAVVKLLVDELNILRAQHSLADRTYAQARTAIRNALDGGV